ncbi:MAG: asparagine synthase (glutamine-hydrolyzing) [Proteobacteria bacterium]|nr:asparagine synthase (glutamine-hydrolyzing) [Pseudomonadota bacterium]
MCGITGIFHFDRERIVDQVVLKKMTDIIVYRGPDGEGYYVHRNIGLGHRRLSIIDLQTGDQPMLNEAGNIVLVFNGEIYNYIELRQELIALGHTFRTNSDSEVIIRAYEQWGVDCQQRFNGMWAFALWDGRVQKLFLSRDRIGEKPLHYCIFDNSLIFASEMKSLFQFGVPRKIRTELIEVYLVMTNIPGPDTFYKDIYKLKPGHCIVVNAAGIREYKYWDLPEIDEQNMLSDKKKIYEEFAYLLEDSIRIRMRSDVPYGAFLSGGLDSSSIVALMSGLSSHPVETFTIGFPEKAFDESKLALEVADKFQTHHHQGTVDKLELNAFIERLGFHFDEPFGDSSAIPTWQVSNYATQKVKMVLTGDGGDEVLSGYQTYTGLKLASLISRFPAALHSISLVGLKKTSSYFQGHFRYKLNHIHNVIETSILPFPQRMLEKRSYAPFTVIKRLTSGIKGKIEVEEFFQNYTSKIPYQDDFYKLMYMNFKHGLPDDYLVKVDRMSMANSLETRTPFLDYRLIDFMTRVDKNVKHQGWERKSVLRKTIGKNLPQSLHKAPKKGFAAPLREWFKSDKNTLNHQLVKVKTILEPKTVEKLIQDNTLNKKDYGNFIWSILILEKYLL